jgi:RNA polymerase sigma-70 factor (ECF subfamily)
MGLRQLDDDARLMLSFQGGDRRAFETLFSRYSAPLVGFLGRMVLDRGRAEELAQEVFVRVYKARDRYEPRARFSTWLFGIAHNLALNELARAYRGRERPLEPVHEETYPDTGPSSEEQLEAKRTQQRLAHALAGLPARQRAALVLRSEQGLAYGEIAEALATSVSSVKSLLHRAREGLLAELEELRP